MLLVYHYQYINFCKYYFKYVLVCTTFNHRMFYGLQHLTVTTSNINISFEISY